MSIRYEIHGAGDFDRLANRLRVAEKDLPREIRNTIDKGVKPLPVAVKRSALLNLPHRGRLNELVARARFSARRVSPTVVEIRAKGIDQLAETNAGRVHHPTFGHRPRVTQMIPRAKDWFFKPVRAKKRALTDELGDAMHRVAKRIT